MLVSEEFSMTSFYLTIMTIDTGHEEICGVFFYHHEDHLLDYVYMFYVCKMCMFGNGIVFNLCQIWSSEKPRGDPVRLTGL